MPGFAFFLLRVALVAGLLLTVGTSVVLAQERVGVNSAVNPEATGALPGAPARRLVIGQDVIFNEHITTAASGQTQLLFLDESSMSIGPNSDLTIDQFVYDPKTGTGKLAMSATRGLLRYVGGKLSKQNDAVTLRTATATLAVRGGAFIVQIQPGGQLNATFLYGKGLTVTGAAGVSQTLTRPGFMVTVSGPGAAPSPPAPAPPGLLALFTQQLDGQSGSSGGAAVVPTDTTAANSGISQTVSGNVAQSVQQAAQNQMTAPTLQSNPTNPAPVPTTVTSTVQSTTPQAAAVTPPPPAVTPPPPVVTPPQPVVTPPLPVVTPPQPVVIQIAGMIKSTPDINTGLGFTDQTASNRVPYGGGTITYASSALQNGTVAATTSGLGLATLSPLTAGSTTAVTATCTVGSPSCSHGTATGTAVTNVDSSFFYADLTGNNLTDKIFVFGGTPVSQSFFAGNLPGQITAFKVNPDGALANGSQAQTIPFLPPAYGGTMANATVSPLYLVTGANSPFGAANSAINNFVSPKFLQASLAVNGQGANQTSALVVNTGSFSTSSTGAVVAGGPIRGTVMLNATSPAVRIASGQTTVPDGNGNNLFGGTTLEGFVLDQNQYNS